MSQSKDNCSTDLASNWRGLILWGLPAAVIIIALFLPSKPAQIIWCICYAIMGWGCVHNARGCNRVHCHFSAPWFLAIAVIFLGRAVNLIPWSIDAALAIIGLIGLGVIWLVTEKLWGQYWRQR